MRVHGEINGMDGMDGFVVENDMSRHVVFFLIDKYPTGYGRLYWIRFLDEF